MSTAAQMSDRRARILKALASGTTLSVREIALTLPPPLPLLSPLRKQCDRLAEEGLLVKAYRRDFSQHVIREAVYCLTAVNGERGNQ